MRRCIKNCGLGFMAALFVLTAIASPSGASVEAVKDTTQTVWPSTIYYIASIKSPDGLGAGYGDVVIHITAINDYNLYVNGEFVGSNTDGDWRTVEGWPVTLPAGNVDIGVEVTNYGTGEGSGLMIDITKEGSSQWLGTSIKKRRSESIGGTLQLFRVQWYYFSGPLASLTGISDVGDEWYKTAPGKLYETGTALQGTQLDPTFVANFKAAMLGNIGDIDYVQNTNVDVITGYVGNTDVSSTEGGGITLRRIEGENLALGRPSDKEQLVDGDLANGFAATSNPIDSGFKVDLERIYRVNKLTLFTGGNNPSDWEKLSVRGYRVEISFDDFNYDQVGVLHNIGINNPGGNDYYSVEFPQEWARYVRYIITESRQDYPNIGEMMVFGVGHVYDGMYESPWMDFGSPTLVKNFGMVDWGGDVPDGTRITIQTKSAYMTQEGQTVESEWSTATTDKSFMFPSPEPATMIKYRVNLTTQDILKAPVMKELSFSYSEDDQPVSFADGWVSPNDMPMGETTTMEYIISYNLIAGQDLKQVQLAVPGFSSLNSVYSSQLGTELTGNMMATQSSVDTLYISFTNPITNADGGTAADSLYISFDTKLLGNSHNFVAAIFNSTGNDGAGGVDVWESQAGSWTVVASSISESLIRNVQASPEAFTPNGDGVNEFTVIEFELSKVQTDVKINIYDTRGSLVTVVADKKLSPGTYLIPDSQKLGANARDLIGYWDGTDQDGDLVPPGVYVFQVVAKTDGGDKVESGTVVVAY